MPLAKEKIKLKFEQVDGDTYRVYRAKVFGGWLVTVGLAAPSVAFVPDPKHEWKVNNAD